MRSLLIAVLIVISVLLAGCGIHSKPDGRGGVIKTGCSATAYQSCEWWQ